MNTDSWQGIGLMSGTSHDGIDLAACTFSYDGLHWQWQILATQNVPYDATWRNTLLGLTSASAETLARVQVDYAHHLGLCLRRFIVAHDLQPQFVASHGHTIFHQPDRQFTLQIGSGETLITYLQCPLVTDFRARDVALGGQGAPLVPMGEQLLFPDCHLFLNLGGIANLSLFATAGQAPFVGKTWLRESAPYLAYDVSACNLALNHLAAQHEAGLHYDPQGSIAAGGTLLPDLMQQLAALPYYQNLPPRSLGREWALNTLLPLLDAHAGSAADKLHTYCHHLAAQLARELQHFALPAQQLLVTGGGARNAFLMQCIDAALTPLHITRIPATAQLIDYKEALVFAFLGLRVLLRQPTTLAGATGARQPVVGGSIHLPSGFSSPLL